MSNKKTAVLIVDNEDSFTFNVVDVLRKFNNVFFDVVLHSNFLDSRLLKYDKFIISPGPGKPSDFKFMRQIIKHCEINNKSLLGICLGHQAICEYYGAKLIQLKRVVHGKQETIRINNNSLLYKGLPNYIEIGLYHSWVIDAATLPNNIIATGKTGEGRLMSVQHKDYDIHGIQFHPESFLTPLGKKIFENFLV